MYKRLILQLTKFTLIGTWLFFFSACANVIAPTGGPKDEIPPQLLDSISYPNKTHNTNRSGHNILLVFNETTEVTNLKNELTATPLIDNKVIKYKVKKIRLKDTSGKSYKGTAVSIDLNQQLDSNTTYVLNFGRSFKDINEGKIATNISIAFSTGNQIDSLGIRGKVIYNRTGKVGKEVMIGLYTINDTSNASNTLPKYYTSTDENGLFKIDYLKNDNYKLVCFTDKNRNNKYDERTEFIAFNPDVIILDSVFDAGDLYLFKEDKRLPEVSRIETFDRISILTFNKGLEKVEIENYDNQFLTFDKTMKKLNIYKKLTKDTTISIKMTDSTGIFSDTTISLHFDSLKIFNKKTTLKTDYQYINSNFKQIISFSQPIFQTDLDSASIYAKDSTYKFDSIVNLNWNANKTELILSARFPKYHDTLFIKNLNFLSLTNDTLTKSSNLVRTQSGLFGSLFFKVIPNEQHYVIDLIDKDHNILKTGRNVKQLELVNYKPQDVFVRVLIDKNNNGKYDTGDYHTNTLPEKYIYSKEGFKVKAGWDIDDLEIVVGKEK